MAHSNPVNLPASGKYVKLYVDWTTASTRANILTGSKSGDVDGEALATSMGKIAKWYTDFKVLTFTDLSISGGTAETGKAITALSYNTSTGVISVTKSTFLTQHPTITTDTDTTSTTSPTHGGTFTAIDSVTRDTNGHVTKVNTKTITLPADSNTDTKVTQTNTTGNADYRVLLSANANDTTETTTSRKSGKLFFNTSSGVLTLKHASTDPHICIDLDTSKPTAGQNVNILQVVYKNADGTVTHGAYPIGIIGNDATGDTGAYNAGVRLGSVNGTTIVGAGESSVTFAAAKGKYNDENLYLVADGSVLLYRGMSNDSTTGSGPWTVGGFTATPTSGQVMIADGTVGGYKTSGYTIAKSVPSNAVFTDHITTATTSGSGNAVTAITVDANGALTVTKGSTFSLSTHTHNYIPLTGSNAISGSLETNSQNAGFVSPGSSNRKMSLINGSLRYYIGTGNWASGIAYLNGNGDTLGSISAYGTPSTCDYFYMGKTYDNVAMRVENDNTGKTTLRGTLPQLKFQQTTSNSEYDNNLSGITAYPADKYGMNMLIQSGGNMIIGAGEYPASFYNATKAIYDNWSDDGESMYVGADSYVMIQPLGNTIANRKSYVFGNDFELGYDSRIYFKIGYAGAYHGGILTAGSIKKNRLWRLPDVTGGVGICEDLYTSTAAPTATSQTINLNGSKTIIGVYDILKVWIYVNSTTNIRQIDMCVMTAAMAQASYYFTGVGTLNQKMIYLNSNGYSLQLGTSGTSDSSKISIAKVIGIRFS